LLHNYKKAARKDAKDTQKNFPYEIFAALLLERFFSITTATLPTALNSHGLKNPADQTLYPWASSIGGKLNLNRSKSVGRF